MAAQTMLVEVVTPYGMFINGRAEMVVLQAKDGKLGVMHGHTPMLAALIPGEIRLLQNGQWTSIAATNGYAEVGPKVCIIVVSAAEHPGDIDAARARQSLRRAQERLRQKSLSPSERKHARHAIERAENRIRIRRRWEQEKETAATGDPSYSGLDIR